MELELTFDKGPALLICKFWIDNFLYVITTKENAMF